MELRNSVLNELCSTVGRTTTKMNANFIPRFFSCLQAVNTHRFRWVARMRFHLKIFPFWLIEAWLLKISGDQRGVKLSILPFLPTKSSA